MQSFTTYDVLSSAFITFLFKFAVTESAQNWLSFFVVLQHLLMHPPIPYRFCLCVCWYHFLLHVQHWNRFHTQHMKQNLHFSGISKGIWIYYTTNHWLSHNIFLSLKGLDLNCPLLIFLFTTPILLGNNQKIKLNWKQNCRSYRR